MMRLETQRGANGGNHARHRGAPAGGIGRCLAACGLLLLAGPARAAGIDELFLPPPGQPSTGSDTGGRAMLRIRFHGGSKPVRVDNSLLYRARFPGKGPDEGLFTGKIRTGGFVTPPAGTALESDGWAGATPPAGTTLAPGTWSAWVDATPALRVRGGMATCFLRLPGIGEGTLDAQLACAPSEDAVAKELQTGIHNGSAIFTLPVSPAGFIADTANAPTPAAMLGMTNCMRFQSLEDLERTMDGFCDQALASAGGTSPSLTRLRFHAFVHTPAATEEATIGRLERLGINTFTSSSDRDGRQVLSRRAIHLKYINGEKYPFSPALPATLQHEFESLRDKLQPGDRNIAAVKLGDEIGLVASAKEVNGDPEGRKLFQGYLETELARLGKPPLFLGDVPGRLDCLPPVPWEADWTVERKRLYVMSQRFLQWVTARHYRLATEAVHKVFPGTETFVNHSTGFMFGSRINPGWVLNCRYNGTTMAWAEDWAWVTGGTAAAGIQTVGFYGALMDCAARPGKRAKGFHTIATANFAAHKIFSLIGEGVFFQDLYNYGPAYMRKGGDCWSDKPWVYEQIAQALAALQPAETRIVLGQPDPTAVAVIINLSDDLRRDTALPGFLTERLMTFMALRHAQMPVDLILEDDIEETALGPYRAIFLHGLRLERARLPALRAWVEAGGTLIATGSAAMEDEFGEPMPEADGLLGVRRAPGAFSPGKWLADETPGLEPLDTVTLAGSAFTAHTLIPVVGLKVNLTPLEGTDSIGTFKDMTCAATLHRQGKGHVLVYGFLPGMSYRSTTCRNADAKSRIDGYRDDLRAVLARPAQMAGGKPRVESSSPLVETTTFSDAAGLAVLLTDFTWLGARSMQLTVRSDKPVRTARLTRGAVHSWKQTPEGVALDLTAPDPVDVLMLEFE